MPATRPDEADSDFVNRQYTRLWESSLAVTTQAMKIYSQAWQEFFTSPQTLAKRNSLYFKEVLDPPRPQWQTPHKFIAMPQSLALLAKLLDFSAPDVPSKGIIPMLVLPPQAGHHSYIADYSAEQSQVQALRQTGLGGMFCIEWLSATAKTSQAGIEEYLEVVRFAVKQAGGKVNLVGDCQGGWLAAIYTALYPETVNTLTVAGAPIDFQAGEGQIKQAVNYIASTYPERGMAYYRSLVQVGKGNYSGSIQTMAFNMMKPQQLPERYLDLYQNVLNPSAVERFREMKNWYDYYQDISGTFYLWLVEHLFRDNELIKNKLVIGGRKVSMKAIKCPVFLLAGSRDHITLPEQVFEMEKYISTPSIQIHKRLVAAGHIGLFMGRDVLTKTWKEFGGMIFELSK